MAVFVATFILLLAAMAPCAPMVNDCDSGDSPGDSYDHRSMK